MKKLELTKEAKQKYFQEDVGNILSSLYDAKDLLDYHSNNASDHRQASRISRTGIEQVISNCEEIIDDVRGYSIDMDSFGDKIYK